MARQRGEHIHTNGPMITRRSAGDHSPTSASALPATTEKLRISTLTRCLLELNKQHAARPYLHETRVLTKHGMLWQILFGKAAANIGTLSSENAWNHK